MMDVPHKNFKKVFNHKLVEMLTLQEAQEDIKAEFLNQHADP